MQLPEPVPDARPPVVVVGTSDLEATVLRRQLDSVADILGFVPDPSHALDTIHERRPALVVLFMDHERTAVLDLSRRLAAEGVPAIMVSRDRDPDTILLAMRSGARDFAYLDGDERDVRRAVSALPVAPVAAPHRRGNVIVVFGCKGGSGATTIATNLAGALLEGADERRRVVVLDLDAQMGDVMVFLDLAPRYNWTDLLRNLPRLDDDLIHRSLTSHCSGLRVVGQGTALEEADRIDAAAVVRTIEVLREHYDYVVIDGVRDFSEISLAALDAADRVALVLTQDVPALKNANRSLDVLRRLGYRGDKIKLIVNRYHKRDKLDLDTMGDALGAPIDATVANDFDTVIRAINQGTLLVASARRARVTDDVRRLIPVLDGGPAPAPTRRGLFGRRR